MCPSNRRAEGIILARWLGCRGDIFIVRRKEVIQHANIHSFGMIMRLDVMCSFEGNNEVLSACKLPQVRLNKTQNKWLVGDGLKPWGMSFQVAAKAKFSRPDTFNKQQGHKYIIVHPPSNNRSGSTKL